MIAVEVQHASLDTLSVTIRALHVKGKQMTLAVFRQLPIEKERETDQLWGIVRYSIKDEGDLWLVFSRDGLLFRSYIEIFRYELTPFSQYHSTVECEILEKLNRLRNYDSKWKTPVEVKKIKDELESELALEREYKKSYWNDLKANRDRTKRFLTSLPQLFIAI